MNAKEEKKYNSGILYKRRSPPPLPCPTSNHAKTATADYKSLDMSLVEGSRRVPQQPRLTI